MKGAAMAKKRVCEICGGAVFTRKATARKPYHYKLSGLHRVFLIGIEVEACRECGMESPSIPKLGELHRIIAHHLVNKMDRLAGDELRFLRKLPGIPARKFAELLRITPEHLSGAENGRRPLSQSVDKLARAIVAEAIRSDETRSILLQYPTEIGEKLAQLRFAYDQNWTRAA
jgi:DNA-binding transcriptional regulator YiaG